MGLDVKMCVKCKGITWICSLGMCLRQINKLSYSVVSKMQPVFSKYITETNHSLPFEVGSWMYFHNQMAEMQYLLFRFNFSTLNRSSKALSL
jgi:hypothetical protein